MYIGPERQGGTPMSDLFEDPAPGPATNAPELTVSEVSGMVRRVVEGEFGHVRVRGEIGRVARPRTGHVYFDLKDDRSVLAAIAWKGQAARLGVEPEEGLEVIATGRLTTFAGQSKYQMIVEALVVAGAGALMAMLDRRRRALAAEGLFDEARKRALPFLPEVIGVVTSPSGAVIRDILHRLRDRFPRQVVIWPVAVQGERCAGEVAAAIAGFNALGPGGPVPRPDLIIVARGGGSIEDLWGFNEEIVVRAAAASAIPLISAVGHETDTTLLDLVADRRAPTPTAAAEMAVPVRLDLMSHLATQEGRLARGASKGAAQRRQRLRDVARGLPRPEALLAPLRQRLDLAGERLPRALAQDTAARRARFGEVATRARPELLARGILAYQTRLADWGGRLQPALARRVARARQGLLGPSARLRPEALGREAARRRLADWGGRLQPALARRVARARQAVAPAAGRLRPEALGREAVRRRLALDVAVRRLGARAGAQVAAWQGRLAAAERLRQSLGYEETLRRGYAVVRGDGAVVTGVAAAEAARALEVQFADGRLALPTRSGRRRDAAAPESQGSLF